MGVVCYINNSLKLGITYSSGAHIVRLSGPGLCISLWGLNTLKSGVISFSSCRSLSYLEPRCSLRDMCSRPLSTCYGGNVTLEGMERKRVHMRFCSRSLIDKLKKERVRYEHKTRTWLMPSKRGSHMWGLNVYFLDC